MTSARYRWGLAAAFVIQATLLAWIVADRALLLTRGKEIRLDVVPVDPRELFRGDYVILSYPISQIASDQIAGDDEFAYEAPIYVSLAPRDDGWEAQSLSRNEPDGGVFLRGRIDEVSVRDTCMDAVFCADYRVSYNLEQFFVPEGEGLELETLRNDQRMSVDVAIADDGRAALKRLLVDGEVRYEESLY